MKRWMGLFLTVLLIGSANQASAQNNSKSPSLKVVCNVLAADITLTVHLPDGDKTVTIGTGAVKLKKGQRYTLSISKKGYTPYKNSFSADWDGLKEKSVRMEKGIGPGTTETWVVDLENSVSMEFEPIPIGSFLMGSNEGEEDEQPVHKVVFSRPFWMAKTEVTQQQYGQFKKVPEVLKEKDVPMPTGAELPVCGVNWNDAMAFCKWLTTNERMMGRLPEGMDLSAI